MSVLRDWRRNEAVVWTEDDKEKHRESAFYFCRPLLATSTSCWTAHSGGH
jgi:hypothetical protein